ncbi:alpha/beta hydrolase-fold protein [Streptomyces sp. H27-H1]|uniref:alpha/beta hydrolase n=1 Tax=Streptomyces sp. H27-H1 TaxID=2996461 RepID=UPI002271ACE8|nr:alpha/beta hydrolase-fold protein [Streptomyces sp. H27-H1]MCY0930391.1 alpha/beta hydrolase-fold protein [Streptomyces sp. H27-H1]
MSHSPDGQHQPYRSAGPYQQQPYGEPYGRQNGQPYGEPYGQQNGQPYGEPYGQPYPPSCGESLPPLPEEPRRPSRIRRWVIAGASVLALAGVASLVMSHYEIPPFTDKGDSVSFGQQPPGGSAGGDTGGASDAKPPAHSKMSMPTGPAADFKNSMTLPDGTHVAVTTLDGKKSGFKGKVWVWAPKAYSDPKFAKSGFPVMVALPGGAGYPNNYWMGTDLGLQASISKWYAEGKSKPFILVMPVLNPGPDDKGIYWDGSDIPGQPKMGTWLTDDVPDLVRANFRTIKSRDGWAYMGSSTGGFASLKAVLKYPEKFKAAICSGPDIVPDSPLWKGHDKEKAENNPELLAKALTGKKGAPDVYLAFQVGTNESNKNTLPNVQKFIAAYGKGPVHTDLKVIQGGKHNAKTYVPNMGEGPIQFISKVMEGPVE